MAARVSDTLQLANKAGLAFHLATQAPVCIVGWWAMAPSHLCVRNLRALAEPLQSGDQRLLRQIHRRRALALRVREFILTVCPCKAHKVMYWRGGPSRFGRFWGKKSYRRAIAW
jgi:hypothetical protein